MSTVRPRYSWQIAAQDRPRSLALARGAHVPPIVGHLLRLRGIDTPEAAARFMEPSLSHISDPFLLSDMRTAVERIAAARDRGELVQVFGDYDVDGISAMAILLNGLRRYGLTRTCHGMPQRLTEGYGLNTERVEDAARAGVSLIITVDNGVSAHEAAIRARELNVDLIITDHHAMDADLPEAVAVVNPKRENDSHPGYQLCGAGVALKLCAALNGTLNDLDIAALGTVADMAPLLGENRVIVALGICHMRKYKRIGLAKLASAANLDLEDVSSEKIGFQLGPRINAAGRLDDGITALNLLLCECPLEAERMAQSLDAANEERRVIEKATFDEAAQELDAFLMPEHRGIVLARRGWHPGVIGIVASRVENCYHRPVVLIAVDEDGVGRGSARSGPGFDMMAALNACQKHLVKFGGHRSAAGLTILEDRVPAFREAFAEEARRQLGTDEVAPTLPVDALASFEEIDAALLSALKRLEPFGYGNPAPTFGSLGVEVLPRSARVLKDRHLKLELRQGGAVFEALGFNMAERLYAQDLPRRIDAAYSAQYNTWRGEKVIQLILKDLRPAE